MPLDRYLYSRPNLRLTGYDYSQNGAYFLTICTYDRECLLGDIVNGEMRLNESGEIVKSEWIRTSSIRQEIVLDCYAVMPNHFHAIVFVRGGDRPVAATNNASGPRPRSIGSFVAGFKSSVTKHVNEIRKTPGIPVWQQNYYEHIIRDDDDLNRILEYIENNPARWAEDEENPSHIKP